MHQENTEYAKAFEEIQGNIQHLSNSIVRFTQECQAQIKEMNATSIQINKGIDDSKLRKQKAFYDWTQIQNKQQGSAQMVDDSVALYNRQYATNVALAIATAFLGVYLFTKRKRGTAASEDTSPLAPYRF